jgi:hypothetical protein
MIETLIYLLAVGLILWLVYYLVGMFMSGQPLTIVGIILGLLFLLYALRTLKILAVVGLSLWLMGCASVVSQVSDGHPNRDRVPVPPGSRAVMMTGTYEDDDWDGWLELPRGAGVFKRNNGIIQANDGSVVGYIEGNINPWVFGNVIYGGPLGAIGDAAIGGGWDLHPYPKLSMTWRAGYQYP